MKRLYSALLGLSMLVILNGCLRSLPAAPTPLPTLVIIPSPTNIPDTKTAVAPTQVVSTPTAMLPSFTPSVPFHDPGNTPTPLSGVIPGIPSGPYVVIQVVPGDVLNIRSGAGAGYPVLGTLAATATNVNRTGPSAMVDGAQWVEVMNPSGGIGWVNANFLAEYIAPATFCADGRVNTLLASFGNALNSANREALAAQVSPSHGMTVYLWRYGLPHTFTQSDARWVFESTFVHNWGAAPASGMDTLGSFHEKVLPPLKEVFNASYTLTCNSLGSATQYGTNPWPVEYANINYYTVYKPGTPGVDLDWRYWLVGIDYIQGQPYIFAVIHFAWEP